MLRQAHSDRVTWVSKAESPQKLVDAIEDAARKMCARCGELHTYAPEGWSPRKVVKTLFPPHDLPPPSMVEDLLRQLFPTSHTVTLESLEDMQPQSWDRSGAAARWSPRSGETTGSIHWSSSWVRPDGSKKKSTTITSISTATWAGSFAPAFGTSPRYFWDLGGVLYTFLGTPSNDLPSFAHFYRQNQDPDVILWPLRHLLNEVWGHFYRDPEPRHPATL